MANIIHFLSLKHDPFSPPSPSPPPFLFRFEGCSLHKNWNLPAPSDVIIPHCNPAKETLGYQSKRYRKLPIQHWWFWGRIARIYSILYFLFYRPPPPPLAFFLISSSRTRFSRCRNSLHFCYSGGLFYFCLVETEVICKITQANQQQQPKKTYSHLSLPLSSANSAHLPIYFMLTQMLGSFFFPPVT